MCTYHVLCMTSMCCTAVASCPLRVFLPAGYDIEDAIVMNKSSLDRGFGRCIVLRKYGTTMKKYKNRTTDRVVKPQVPVGQVSHCGTAANSVCLTATLPEHVYVSQATNWSEHEHVANWLTAELALMHWQETCQVVPSQVSC